MYGGGPSIHLRPTTIQIASMKEEKELSPREGGNLLSCPQNEMGGERREGRKRKRNGQAEIETDPDIREVCTLLCIIK